MKEIKTGKPLPEQESRSLDTYLQEIGRNSLLSAEEEALLSEEIKKGSQKAVARLTESNLRFVVHIAKQYQDKGLGMPDLISEGNIGLIKAAQRFDASKGQRFVEYAVWWIRRSIENAIQEQAGIYRLPHEPKDAADSRGSRAFSVDAPLTSNPNVSLLHVLGDPNAKNPAEEVLEDATKDEIRQALEVLAPRERAIVEATSGLGGERKTYAETATVMGLKRERVRQIRKAALRKLKKRLRVLRNL